MKKDLLKLLDLTREDITRILNVAYLLVKGVPMADITGMLAKFSEAISSIRFSCRSISAWMASATWGSTARTTSMGYISPTPSFVHWVCRRFFTLYQ